MRIINGVCALIWLVSFISLFFGYKPEVFWIGLAFFNSIVLSLSNIFDDKK
jgi:hypothetical protein